MTKDQQPSNNDYFAHESAYIDEGCEIGRGTKIWHFSHVMSGSTIGENCNIGQNVVIGPDVTIGKGCKIQNNVSVYKGVTLEDGVFCGPSMVFTNIYNPRAEIRKMDQVRPTLVQRPRRALVAKDAENPFSEREAYFFSRLSKVRSNPVLLEEFYLDPAHFPGAASVDLRSRKEA